MIRPRPPGRLLPALLLVLALTAGGAANAYWSEQGSGAGAGTTGTTVAVTLGPGTPTSDLFPGGQADVVLTVSNPNAFDVLIGSLTLDPGQGTAGYAADGGHPSLGQRASAPHATRATELADATSRDIPVS
jgi:hypothetical protein